MAQLVPDGRFSAPEEFSDLVAFVRNGLPDTRARSEKGRAAERREDAEVDTHSLVKWHSSLLLVKPLRGRPC
jgi:hypothetical protein